MNSRRRISAPKLRGQHCIGSNECLTLVKIGEPSHTRRFASERAEFSPNGYSALSIARKSTGSISLAGLSGIVAPCYLSQR